jgi:hypothetical protein
MPYARKSVCSIFLLRNLHPKPYNRKTFSSIIKSIGPERIRSRNIFLMRNLNPRQIPKIKVYDKVVGKSLRRIFSDMTNFLTKSSK